MPKIRGLLTADHLEIGSLLGQACGPPLDLVACEALRALLLRHIAKEERVLFPAARQALGHRLPGMARLREDHAALASLMVPTPTAEILGIVRRILDEHDELEEGPEGMYAACERVLSPAATEQIAIELAAVPQVPLAPHFDGTAARANVARLLAQRGRS